jgi:hypothetical protein
MNLNAIRSSGLGVLLAAGLLAGCANQDKAAAVDPDRRASHKDPFFRSDYFGWSARVGAQQAASAARADTTLYEAHFHGGKLNSLGEDKLGLALLDDNDSRPIGVYLAFAADHADGAARRESVLAYLTSRGLAADEVRLEAGPNPAVGTPAARLLEDLKKTDSGSAGMGGEVN